MPLSVVKVMRMRCVSCQAFGERAKDAVGSRLHRRQAQSSLGYKSLRPLAVRTLLHYLLLRHVSPSVYRHTHRGRGAHGYGVRPLPDEGGLQGYHHR